MAIKNTEKPRITMPEAPESTSSKVDIFIWGGGDYKETNKKYVTFENNNKKNYSLLLHYCTRELYCWLKGVDNYETIDIDQCVIDLENTSRRFCHIK